MKVFGQEFLIGTEGGKTDADTLLRFAMSLPVTTAVAGMPKVEMLEHNVELARNFSPFSAEQDGSVAPRHVGSARRDATSPGRAHRWPHRPRRFFGRKRPSVDLLLANPKQLHGLVFGKSPQLRIACYQDGVLLPRRFYGECICVGDRVPALQTGRIQD